jgi:UDP-N-acetylglucosamine 2-epimerase (non-hydrolysing)
MIKTLSVFGTRPEAIKMATVVRELEKHPDQIESVVCITAQHREMLDQILDLFEIKPNYDLNLMQTNQTLENLTARVLVELTPIIKAESPDWLLVQGDTTTVMAASLAAFYQNVKIGHVEAGLRTGDKRQPFPEEINRRIAGVVADLHFAPTDWARSNLLKEGIPPERVIKTGNTVIDALHWVSKLPPTSNVADLLKRIGIDIGSAKNDALQPSSPRLILVTAHRRENFGKPFENICFALREIAEQYQDRIHIVYPVHLNPNVQEPAFRLLGNIPNITLLPPLDYLSLVSVMRYSYIVMTDSGGIQEEAPGLGKPVLVFRSKTERPEGVETGTVKLVGTDKQKIIVETRHLLDDQHAYNLMAQASNPYGDGQSSARIVKGLLNYE